MVKQTFIIALFSLFGHFCVGQGKIMSIPVNFNGDTSFWYKHQHERFAKIGLSNLAHSKDSLVLRVSTEIQAVEIKTVDFKTFTGTVHNFAESVLRDRNQRNKEMQNELFFNKTTRWVKLCNLNFDVIDVSLERVFVDELN